MPLQPFINKRHGQSYNVRCCRSIFVSRLVCVAFHVIFMKTYFSVCTWNNNGSLDWNKICNSISFNRYIVQLTSHCVINNHRKYELCYTYNCTQNELFPAVKIFSEHGRRGCIQREKWAQSLVCDLLNLAQLTELLPLVHKILILFVNALVDLPHKNLILLMFWLCGVTIPYLEIFLSHLTCP